MIAWVSIALVRILHDRQVSEHGGAHGIRDEGLLASALARPQNIHAYEGGTAAPDIPRLAAAYAYGLSSNHCFIDGNKRTALLVSFLFIEKNGFRVTATEEDAYQTFVRLAAGEISEEDLTAWFRRCTQRKA